MKQPISKEEIVALIGRPLSSYEESNFAILTDLATERLDMILNCGFSEAESWTSGLKILFARMFQLNEAERANDSMIVSKSVDGYSVSFKSGVSRVADFCEQNAGLIAKYKKSSTVRHGETIYDCF